MSNSESEIVSTIVNNLNKSDVVFVFSTDVVKNSWVDFLVMNPDISGKSAVALERFIAWDDFKREYISSSQKGKSAVPTTLKKLFVRNLIFENETKHYFKKIIAPEYAQSAMNFSDWLASLLPSLDFWYRRYSALIETDSPAAKAQEADEENQDYLFLYEKYKTFLESNNMFEPSWIRPDFTQDEKQFIVFYPEIYDDYVDYVDILNENARIEVIHLPDEVLKKGPRCYAFENSRQELRRIILQMRELVEQNKCQWNEIALNVPQLELYRPYLERELKKYCVPFVIRSGVPLTQCSAGQFFNEIEACVKSNFSYDSVRALLLDEYMPWKDTIKLSGLVTDIDLFKTKENLIREGQRMHCVCPVDTPNGKHIDIWEESLGKMGNQDYEELELYKALKNIITSIYNAKTFAQIEKGWQAFREKFLNPNSFSTFANQVLSRCITELKQMSVIEEQYCGINKLTIDCPYDFFLREIETKTYTPQNKTVGLNVYPYRLSCMAKFKYQFVIDASQDNLELPNKRLSFLSTEKRMELGLVDDDKRFNPSRAYVYLYSQNSCDDEIQFSYSEDTFSGFSIAHTFLDLQKNNKDDKGMIHYPLEDLDKKDFWLNERDYLLWGKKTEPQVSQLQKDSYENWDFMKLDNVPEYCIEDPVKEAINDILINNRNEKWQENAKSQNLDTDGVDEKSYIVSQSDLKSFYECPRKWLYARVLSLNEDSLSADLLGDFDIGNINHKILELFFDYYKENKLPLPCTNEEGIFLNEEKIKKLLETVTDKAIHSASKDINESQLEKIMLLAQKNDLIQQSLEFLESLCRPWDKKFGLGGFTVLSTEGWKVGYSKDKSVRYSGKIDCVVCDPNGNIYIIDYKTGKTSGIGECMAKPADDNMTLVLKNYQMAMYITIYNAGKADVVNEDNSDIDKKKVENALFYSLNKGDFTSIVFTSTPKVGRDSKSLADYQPTLGLFEEYTKRFADKLNNDGLEPVNNPEDYYNCVSEVEDCDSCRFKGICRVKYSLAQRKLKRVESAAQKEEK